MLLIYNKISIYFKSEMLFQCMLAIDIYSTGSNAFGKLGVDLNPDDVQQTEYFIPFATPELSLISSGKNHVVAVTNLGELYAWGSN